MGTWIGESFFFTNEEMTEKNCDLAQIVLNYLEKNKTYQLQKKTSTIFIFVANSIRV